MCMCMALHISRTQNRPSGIWDLQTHTYVWDSWSVCWSVQQITFSIIIIDCLVIVMYCTYSNINFYPYISLANTMATCVFYSNSMLNQIHSTHICTYIHLNYSHVYRGRGHPSTMLVMLQLYNYFLNMEPTSMQLMRWGCTVYFVVWDDGCLCA